MTMKAITAVGLAGLFLALSGQPCVGIPTSHTVPPKVSQPLPAPTTLNLSNGSVVVTDAKTGPTNGQDYLGQIFRAVAFRQITDLTEDTRPTLAVFKPSGVGPHENHIDLERGILVFQPTGAVPESAPGTPDLLLPEARPAMHGPRLYPISTVRSVGAGAEGSTIMIVAVTRNIISQDPMNGDFVEDVVILILDGQAGSRGFVRMPDASVDAVLPVTQKASHFLAFKVTTPQGGQPQVSDLAKHAFDDHKAIADLRSSFSNCTSTTAIGSGSPGCDAVTGRRGHRLSRRRAEPIHCAPRRAESLRTHRDRPPSRRRRQCAGGVVAPAADRRVHRRRRSHAAGRGPKRGVDLVLFPYADGASRGRAHRRVVARRAATATRARRCIRPRASAGSDPRRSCGPGLLPRPSRCGGAGRR